MTAVQYPPNIPDILTTTSSAGDSTIDTTAPTDNPSASLTAETTDKPSITTETTETTTKDTTNATTESTIPTITTTVPTPTITMPIMDTTTKPDSTTDPTTTTTTPQPQPERLLCWTVCAYRKPGLSEDEYHKYMSEVHAPLVRDLMVKYGFVQWSMTHQTPLTRTLMSQLVGPQFNAGADYDCIVQCTFRSIEDFVRMKQDPFYKEKVMADHENFADTKRSKMMVGWIEDHVRGGRVVV